MGEILLVDCLELQLGESHGKALGAVVDGCPPGIKLNEMKSIKSYH